MSTDWHQFHSASDAVRCILLLSQRRKADPALRFPRDVGRGNTDVCATQPFRRKLLMPTPTDKIVFIENVQNKLIYLNKARRILSECVRDSERGPLRAIARKLVMQ